MDDINNTDITNQVLNTSPTGSPIIQPIEPPINNLSSINNPKKTNPIVFIGVIILVIIVSIGSYFFQTKKTTVSQEAINTVKDFQNEFDQKVEDLKESTEKEIRLEGSDASSMNTAAELLNAFERFYASNNLYPWQSNKDSDRAQYTEINSSKWIEGLFSQSELMPSFRKKITNPEEKYTLYTNGESRSDGLSGQDIFVCFIPKSAKKMEEVKTRCVTDIKINNTDLCLSGKEQLCVPSN